MANFITSLTLNKIFSHYIGFFWGGVRYPSKEADIGARVIRVEPDELVTASEIAERTGRTRESIRLLAAGKRGQGGFPPPLRGMKSRIRLWRWAEVALWLAEREGDLTDPLVDEAHTIAAINGALELRRHAPDSSSYLIKRIAGSSST